jgi:glycosyltransferase involved in cell wall biosynthesis
MVIGIDASRANLNHKSGTEWYSYYLIRWIAKFDAENEYILYTDKPLRGGLLDLTTKQHFNTQEDKIEYDKKGFQILKSPHNNFKAKVLKWPFAHLWTQGRLSWEMLIKRPDVLFVPAHTMPVIHPKKTIVTIHDIGFERECHLYQKEQMGPESRGGRKILNLFVALFTWGKYQANSLDYLRWSTEYALKKADKVITITNFTKNELIDIYGAKENKIRVIYNGYNKLLYKKESDQTKLNEVLKKYGITKPYLFYIGRIERKKNIPSLIEAFAIAKENYKLKDLSLVLVGDASSGYDEVKYSISEFDLVNDVIMPGWVEEEDVPYLYNGAEAFIFPSNYEGFGIPLLQAMACEAPIISSSTSSIPEVVEDAAYLVNPQYVTAIAEGIGEVIKKPELRKDLINKGKTRIKDFSWEKCAKETFEQITYK